MAPCTRAHPHPSAPCFAEGRPVKPIDWWHARVDVMLQNFANEPVQIIRCNHFSDAKGCVEGVIAGFIGAGQGMRCASHEGQVWAALVGGKPIVQWDLNLDRGIVQDLVIRQQLFRKRKWPEPPRECQSEDGCAFDCSGIARL